MRIRNAVLVIFACLILSGLTIAYWNFKSPVRHEFYEYMIIIGGLVGIIFAYWRCKTADENFKQDRYRIGSELLDMHGPYAARVAGAATLAALAKKDPSQYDARVMKAFEAYLAFPPVYGGQIGGHQKGKVDYKSRDTEEVVRAINARTRRQRKRYRVVLPQFSPFIVTRNGDVKGNPKHPDYQEWEKVEGQAPTYCTLKRPSWRFKSEGGVASRYTMGINANPKAT